MRFNRSLFPGALLPFLLAAGCADMTPEEQGALAGAVVGAPFALVGMDLGNAVALGAGGAVQVIAQRTATERQREIAKQNASRYLAHTTKTSAEADSKPASPRSKSASSTRKPKVTSSHSRFIAVDTERDSRVSGFAQKSVMVFDTQAHEIVGTKVYDLKGIPPVGAAGRFDTITAEYVGVGLR